MTRVRQRAYHPHIKFERTAANRLVRTDPEMEGSMRDRWPGVFAGVLFSALLLTTIGGCEKPAPPPAPPPPPVTVARPVEREVIEWDEYTGHLQAKEIVEVRARVSGFVEKAEFDEGSMVKAGQLLFVIDPRPFQAVLAQQQAQVQRAVAQRDFAVNEFRRIENLRPTGGASELELENARQRMLESEAAVAAAQAQVQAAQLDVEFTRVTAPISGRISRKYVTPGNLINGGEGQSTLLTTITSIDPIYAYTDVDETSVLKYQRLALQNKRDNARDMKIPIFMALSNEQGFPHEGVIDFVDNRIDPDTGTLRARGVFSNPTGYLTPGMFVVLRIPGSGRYKTMLVPDLAIGTDQDQRFVLVVKDEGTVERRVIQPGALFGRFRSIEEGISENDRIIINGLQRARPGAKVNAQETQINADEVQMTAPGSPATQSLPSTRRLPATRSTPATTAPATSTPATTAPIGAATIGAAL